MTENVCDCEYVSKQLLQKDVLMVDIRGPVNWAQGIAVCSKMMTANDLRNKESQLKSKYNQIFIICHKGNLSNQLATELGEGFISVKGGFEDWISAGLDTEIPAENTFIRYDRQLKLSGFGTAEQQKLQGAHVLVVGLGGLGSPVATYLAAAGIGQLTLVDGDEVALHNLHRQVLYHENDTNQLKVNTAANRLSRMNSEIQIHSISERLTSDNADELIKTADLIVDGTDNLQTRYVINQACLRHEKPWVFAAVSGFNLQVSMFSGKAEDLCFRCLFGDLPDEAIGNCNDEGILGPTPGAAAMIQSTEVLKYLTGLGSTLNQQMLNYDLLNHEFKVIKYPPNSNKCALHNHIL